MWFDIHKKKKMNSAFRLCPKCLTSMDRIFKTSISYDVCDKCDVIWLDDDEIDNLIRISKITNLTDVLKNKPNEGQVRF